MKKYLYLTEKDWVKPWVEGGQVPIGWSSWYKADARGGTKTPDENLIYDAPVDIANLGNMCRLGHIEGGLTITGSTYNGAPIPDMINVQHRREDGYLFCLSNRFDSDIAKRLEKQACVRIENVEELKELIDEQLGIVGVLGECEYTADHRRDHFLKSYKDTWQDEFRMFWRVDMPIQELEAIDKEAVWVTLRPGVAAAVDLLE
jgi:hypothetical protein